MPSKDGNVQLPDPLEEKHHVVASALATGSTIKAAGKLIGVSDATVTRWKRHQVFLDLIEHYRPANRIDRAVQAQQENHDLLQEARDAEILLTAELRDALEQVIGIIKKRLDCMTEDEIEELAVRHLSPLLKIVGDGLGILQQSHDRLTGYGMMLKELENILESRQAAFESD